MTLLDSEHTLTGAPFEATAWIQTPAGDRILLDGHCALGRSASNQIVLPGERVSRHHAAIEVRNPETFWLRDLGSVNGTWLNGRRLQQPTRIYHQDVIGIGPHRVTFCHPAGGVRPRTDQSMAEMTIGDAIVQNCWLLLLHRAPLLTSGRQKETATSPGVQPDSLDQGRSLVEENGGAIRRYFEDGFLASWPDQRSVRPRVAQTLQQLSRVQAADRGLFRLVLHYGQASLGSPDRAGEEAVTGAAVNLTLRMDKLAAMLPAVCLVSEVAQALLAPCLALVETGRHALPGYEGEHTFYRLPPG